MVDPAQKVMDAIKTGNMEEAMKNFEVFRGDVERSHRDKMHMIGISLDFIVKKLGEQALEELWRLDFEDLGLIKIWKNMTKEELSNAIYIACRFVSSPLPSSLPGGDFSVSEDDEKFVVEYNVCD